MGNAWKIKIAKIKNKKFIHKKKDNINIFQIWKDMNLLISIIDVQYFLYER